MLSEQKENNIYEVRFDPEWLFSVREHYKTHGEAKTRTALKAAGCCETVINAVIKNTIRKIANGRL